MALNHTVTGSVNYTVVGTPTIVDGVASGFSSSDYVNFTNKISYLLPTDTLEIGVKFKTGATVGQMSIMGNGTNQTGTGFRISTDSKLQARLRVENSPNLANADIMATCNYVLQANTIYSAKISIKNYSLDLFLYDGNGSLLSSASASIDNSYTRYGGIQSSYKIGYAQQGAFNGSVYLNSTYIKVNGQAWFGVCPVEVKHINYGTSVGYVLTGNATVTNGVLGNLDTSSTAYTSSSLPEDYNKIEIVFKLGYNTTATTAGYFPVCGFGGAVSQRKIGWIFSNSAGLTFKTSNSADALSEVPNSSLNPVTTLNNNGFIFAKMLVENIDVNYNVTLSASADGTNWVNGTTGQTDTDPIGGRTIYLLRNTSGAASGKPILFLGSSYIKVDDKLWFYRPATNYLVKDGKLVFADSGIYIDDNGTKTYASANIAPVPSGFTYGNTTTTDVGYVDMTTQAFTAVPGATWGKDE